MLRAVIWKELLELSRDRRTLALVVLMPLLGLPALGLLTGALYHEQVASVTVFYEDRGIHAIANWLASDIAQRAASSGIKVSVDIKAGSPKPGCCDVYVYLPRGFHENLTSISKPLVAYIGKLLASQAAESAYYAARGALGDLSQRVAVERVEVLINASGLEASPELILHPLEVREYTFKPSGAIASPREQLAAETARLLEFALIFVVNPAVVYVTDAIVGERERKTLEALLATPLGARDVVLGKMVASAIIGLTAALADSLGVLVFFWSLGGSHVLPFSLLGLHALVSGVLVFMTAAIIAPIASRSPSIRSAQATGMAVLSLATAIYFAALFTDISSLPAALKVALLVIPFTHAALAINSYAIGSMAGVAVHVAVMTAVALAAVAVSIRLTDPEAMILVKE
ncbi:MAG: ABC transporter permease subunit [Desulfurococcales archaeon]|nr:ABC transporter permease subunit [Desulfurococcales archaeon]